MLKKFTVLSLAVFIAASIATAQGAGQSTATLDCGTKVTMGASVEAVMKNFSDLKSDAATVKELGELEGGADSDFSHVNPSEVGIRRLKQDNIYGTAIESRGFYFYQNKLYRIIDFYGSMDELSKNMLLSKLIGRYGSYKSGFEWNHSRNLMIKLGGNFVEYTDPIAEEQVKTIVKNAESTKAVRETEERKRVAEREEREKRETERRKKEGSGIGYGSGYGSGFGGKGGGIDNLLNTGGGGGLETKKRGELKVSSPDFLKGGALTGGRSRASIQRVVMQNMAALRYAYNRRLHDKPDLNGKITVKFAIDEFGKVTSAQVVESTMADSELEKTVVDRVKSWDFGRIDKSGDITEVTYPFVFSQ